MKYNPCFVFLEASIETIPKELRGHPIIIKECRKRKKKVEEILLDDSKHHSIMRNLKNHRKRGRPDIIHMCLLSVLDSKIGKSSKIFVHTISGKIIEFSSNVRLPRNYNRFIGLMEKLLSDGKIVSNETLIEIRDMNLSELLMRYSDRRFYLLSEDGKTGEPEFDENPLIMIGAFPHGDFNNETKRDIEKFNPQKISIGDESYTSLYVTSRVICSLERRLERVTGKSLQKMER